MPFRDFRKAWRCIRRGSAEGWSNGSRSRVVTAKCEGIPHFEINVHPPEVDRVVSAELASSGQWEPFESKVVARLVPAYDIFVDIGANIGWYTIIAGRILGSRGVVHSFEPDAENAALLAENVRRNMLTNVRINRCAISDKIGVATLSKSKDNYGDHRLGSIREARIEVQVPVTTLDAYFGDRYAAPLLVKIDTQGSESRILRGIRRMPKEIAKNSTFILEYWPFGLAALDESPKEFVEQLASLPHSIYILDQLGRRLIPIDRQTLIARTKTNLAPVMERFDDLLLINVGSPAWATVADLISHCPPWLSASNRADFEKMSAM
jgi:FkbM family methyltransferase